VQERNDIYAVQLEIQLSKLFSLPDSTSTVSDAVAGALPFHFYGELVKTEEGRQILGASGHFKSFAAFVREFGLEDQNLEIIQRLKAILWAVVRPFCCCGPLAYSDRATLEQAKAVCPSWILKASSRTLSRLLKTRCVSQSEGEPEGPAYSILTHCQDLLLRTWAYRLDTTW
jgi:hypothetical protein